MRKCKKCGETKPLERFPIAHSHPEKKYRKYTCYNCVSSAGREQHWKRRGIPADWEFFKTLFEAAGGCCEICGKELALYTEGRKTGISACLDHDHATGKPRGVLCEICNRAIGLLQDSPDLLEKAADYLREKK